MPLENMTDILEKASAGKYAFIDGFITYHDAHNTEYNPLKVVEAQFDALKAGVIEKINLFGSAGKA